MKHLPLFGVQYLENELCWFHCNNKIELSYFSECTACFYFLALSENFH